MQLCYFRSVLGTNLCEQDPLPCDTYTTDCTNTKGKAFCFCKPGYIDVVYSNSSCRGKTTLFISLYEEADCSCINVVSFIFQITYRLYSALLPERHEILKPHV